MPRPALDCWLYASDCILPQPWTPKAVEDIVATSVRRNAGLAVTGALLFTGARFVQFLEGPATGIAAIRHSIMADTRHRNVQTIMDGPHHRRDFESWSLAYNGPSLFVADRVDALLGGHRDDTEAIISLLREFTLPPVAP